MDQVRIGVVGVGNNGRAFVDCYQANEKAQLVAVCDTNEARLQTVANETSVQWATTDFNELVTSPDIEAISVHSADASHVPITIAALRHGKHVFVEKPMATKLEDCYEVIDLSESTGLKVQVGLVLRFNPFFRGVKQMVESGELGQVFYAEADYICNYLFHQDVREAIRTTYDIAFANAGTHVLDLLRWYLGEPVEVQAYGNQRMSNWPQPEMKDDLVCAIYKFASGAVAKVAATWGSTAQLAGVEMCYNLSLFGSKASIIRDRIARVETQGEFEPLAFDKISGHPYTPEVDAFVEAIIEDKPPVIDARDGGNTSIGILAAMEALRRGEPVKIETR